jgi:hypothetical protein
MVGFDSSVVCISKFVKSSLQSFLSLMSPAERQERPRGPKGSSIINTGLVLVERLRRRDRAWGWIRRREHGSDSIGSKKMNVLQVYYVLRS